MDEKKQAATLSNDKMSKGILKKTDTSSDTHKKSVRFSEEIGIQLVPARKQPYIKKTIDQMIEYAASLSCFSNSRTKQKEENKQALIGGSKTVFRESADENPRMKDLQDQSEDIGSFKLSSETNLVSENETIGTVAERQKSPLLHQQSIQTSPEFSFIVPEKKNLKGTIEKAMKEAPIALGRKAKEVERTK